MADKKLYTTDSKATVREKLGLKGPENNETWKDFEVRRPLFSQVINN